MCTLEGPSVEQIDFPVFRRRAGGTIFGGVVALSCLYWNPQGMPAFLFIELFLITFAGKFLSTYKCIDYGGVTFGLTFHIVVLGQSDNNIRQSFQAGGAPAFGSYPADARRQVQCGVSELVLALSCWSRFAVVRADVAVATCATGCVKEGVVFCIALSLQRSLALVLSCRALRDG